MNSYSWTVKSNVDQWNSTINTNFWDIFILIFIKITRNYLKMSILIKTQASSALCCINSVWMPVFKIVHQKDWKFLQKFRPFLISTICEMTQILFFIFVPWKWYLFKNKCVGARWKTNSVASSVTENSDASVCMLTSLNIKNLTQTTNYDVLINGIVFTSTRNSLVKNKLFW